MNKNKIPSPKQILKDYPLEEKEFQFIENSRLLAKNIFLRKEKKVAIFVGPCSVHDEEQIADYALNLKRMVSYANKNIFIIMRFFYEKSRTSLGWKGFLYDPYLDGSNNIVEGIIQTRKLMLRLTQMGIPLAVEVLDPFALNYFKDLITWGFIGSRTSSSQIHRQIASSLPFPVGIKNNEDGNLKAAINSLASTRSEHSYLSLSDEGSLITEKSNGNSFSHLVLRGSENNTNYDKKSILELYKNMKEKNIQSPIVIDAAHGNSKKSIEAQKKCFKEIINQMKNDPQIIGAMLESFLKEGNQPLISSKTLKYGLSITDPCIGFENTRKLLLWAHEFLRDRFLDQCQ